MGLSLGIGLGVTRRGGGAAAWTPASPAGYVTGDRVSVARAGGGLWQNPGLTIPAVVDGDPARAWQTSGGITLTAAADAQRPLLWDDGGGYWKLVADGVDDSLSTTTMAVADTGYTVVVAGQLPDWASSQRFVFRLFDQARGLLCGVLIGTLGRLRCLGSDWDDNGMGPVVEDRPWAVAIQVSGTATRITDSEGGTRSLSHTPTLRVADLMEFPGAAGEYSGAAYGFALYDRALSDADAASALAYFAASYPPP